MSDTDTPSSQRHKRDGFWSRLRARLGRPQDATLRESLEGVIESHGAGHPDDPLKAEAKSMMLNLIEFAELRVDDVMVPRADIVAVEQGASVRELLDRFIDANHSRLPVYRETLDDPIGMVHIKDLVRWMSVKGAKSSRRKRAEKNDKPEKNDRKELPAAVSLSATDLSMTVKQAGLVRDMLFVPPSMPAPDLLIQMQATHIHMAIVVDEYGGSDGLVSIEDLVEEIVGDISDEHDDDQDQMIRSTGEGVYVADARVYIDKLEELLGVDFLPEERDEETDTLGGLVFSMLGRVPVRGEIIRHDSGIEFEVLESDPRRVKRIRIHTKTKPEGATEPAKVE